MLYDVQHDFPIRKLALLRLGRGLPVVLEGSKQGCKGDNSAFEMIKTTELYVLHAPGS